MEGKNKYRPTKTQLTLAQLKSLCDSLKNDNRKMAAELEKANRDKEWAMNQLQEVQADNRRLGLIILRMTEGKGDNAK